MAEITWLPTTPCYTDYRPVFTLDDGAVIYEHTNVSSGATVLCKYTLDTKSSSLLIANPPTDLPAQTRPDVASDGTVALTGDLSGSNGFIWLTDENGGNVTKLDGTFGMCYPAWYADAQQMAVMNTNENKPFSCAIDRSGKTTIARLMPDTLYAGMPSISHETSPRLAFPGQPTGSPYDQNNNHLYIANNPTSAFEPDPNHQARAPWWSPDATRIVFESNRSGSGYAIYVITLGVIDVVESLTDPSIGAQHAKWSHDGTQVVFCGKPPGGSAMAIGIIPYTPFIGT